MGRDRPTGLSRRQVLGLVGGAAALGALGGCSSGSRRPRRPPTRPPAAGVPEPTGFVRTRWADDPWARGAYSYLPVGATPDLRDALAAPAGARVHLAGEATWRDAPATVHGARASGLRAARAVERAGGGDVVVIGAGAAGAAAAAALAGVATSVVVLEARDRTGGRIGTTTPEGWPVPVELGASWVHDVDASDLAERLADADVAAEPFGYATSSLDEDGRPLDGGDDAYAAGEAGIEEALAWAEDQDADTSLLGALTGSGAAGTADPAGLALALHSEVVVELGAEVDELSAWWALDEGTTGDDLLVVGGYGAVVDADLAEADVRLGWAVAAVDHRGERVVVTADDGRTVEADHVVVTLPLAVLAAEVVRFDPPLPRAHREALAALGTGLLDKVWLRWDEPWWSEEAEVWSRVDGTFEWCNLAPATGEAVLLGLVGGRTAREWTDRSDDELLRSALADLRGFADAGW